MTIGIIPISGFRQRNRHVIPNGIRRFWIDHLRPLSSHEVFIHPPIEWDRDPRDVVGTLIDAGITDLIIVSHSWGTGNGARRLVDEALKRGLQVRLVASCDGVWKSILPRLLAAPLSIFSLTRFPVIPFPDEVGKVVGVFQKRDRPSGHRIRHRGKFIDLIELDAVHATIDDHPEWMSIAFNAITNELIQS